MPGEGTVGGIGGALEEGTPTTHVPSRDPAGLDVGEGRRRSTTRRGQMPWAGEVVRCGRHMAEDVACLTGLDADPWS